MPATPPAEDSFESRSALFTENKFSALGHRFCGLYIILGFFVFIFVVIFGIGLLANRWTSGAPGLVELPLTVFISKPWWDWQGAFLLCSEADCKQPIASFRERFLTWTTTGYMMNSEYQHNLTVSYDTMWSPPWQPSPYTIADANGTALFRVSEKPWENTFALYRVWHIDQLQTPFRKLQVKRTQLFDEKMEVVGVAPGDVSSSSKEKGPVAITIDVGTPWGSLFESFGVSLRRRLVWKVVTHDTSLDRRLGPAIAGIVSVTRGQKKSSSSRSSSSRK